MDQEVNPSSCFLKDGILPEDTKLAKKIQAKAAMYAIYNDILYYVGPTQTRTSQAVVPQQLRQKIMHEYHDGCLAGHFSGPRLYKTLVQSWWWPHIYTDVMNYVKNCVIIEGTGRK